MTAVDRGRRGGGCRVTGPRGRGRRGRHAAPDHGRPGGPAQPGRDRDGYTAEQIGDFHADVDKHLNIHQYYGWTDSPPGTPFLFTPRGTEIKALIYGALSPGGMSWAPFEARDPGYGRHTIEFRAIDAAGNISRPQRFGVIVEPGAGAPPPEQLRRPD